MKNLSVFLNLIILISISGCGSLHNSIESATYTKEEYLRDDSIWIYHIAGIQCGITYFTDIGTAIMYLNSHEIEVIDSKELNFIARAACGYPSGLRMAAKIHSDDLLKAQALGWILINDPKILYKYNLN